MIVGDHRKARARVSSEACGRQWTSDAERRCTARRVPAQPACLAHLPAETVAGFLAEAAERPALLTGLFGDLEMSHRLLRALRPALTTIAPVDFRDSVFVDGFLWTEESELTRADFSSCVFQGPVVIENVTFSGAAHFLGARFEDRVSLAGSTFLDEARFDRAEFCDTALLGARFEADAWFTGAVFGAQASFAPGAHRIRLDEARIRDLFLGPLPVDPSGARPLVTLHAVTTEVPVRITASRDVDLSLSEVALRHPLTLVAQDAEVRLLSLRDAVLDAPLVVGEGADLGPCRMTGAVGLANVVVNGSVLPWLRYRHRAVIADEIEGIRRPTGFDLPAAPLSAGEGVRHPRCTARTVEASYRQLRVALEASKAFEGAADFFYGEMEMRRLCAPVLSSERALLSVFRAVAGYGVRAYRALVSYLVVLLLAGAAIHLGTDLFVADRARVAGSSGLDYGSYRDCVAIVVRNSVSFFGGLVDGLTAPGVLLMFLVRLAGPAAFALMIFAIRSRVQR